MKHLIQNMKALKTDQKFLLLSRNNLRAIFGAVNLINL